MLLAVAGPVLGERLVCVAVLVLLLPFDELIDAVEGDAAVVADDAPATVGVRQASDNVRGAGGSNPRCVDIKDRVVVGLAVLRENLLDLGVDLLTGLLDGGLDHAPATVGHHRALEGGVRLQADDNVVVGGDETGLEGVDIGGGVGVDVEDADLAFLGKVLLFEGVPDAERLVGGTCEEGGIALVRRVVTLDEVADVDFFVPISSFEIGPSLLCGDAGSGLLCHRSSSQ